jgi:hypothetical protein
MTHTIKRTADYIKQHNQDEGWYIHPVEIEWNPKREAWAYKVNGYNMRSDSLETILSYCDQASLQEFFEDEVVRYSRSKLHNALTQHSKE